MTFISRPVATIATHAEDEDSQTMAGSGLIALLRDLYESFANFAVKSFLMALPLLSFAQTDSRIPPEVLHKAGYVNSIPKPLDFTSVMLWGIAIGDSRVPGYENATVEIAETRLTCRVDGKNIVLNDDRGAIRGGLYSRFPWFGTDAHDPMPLAYSSDHNAVILRVGARPDRVWHFWAASPRKTIPPGKLDGCTVKVRVKISLGALLQVGFDYWRNETVGFGAGGNNHEAGASDWYFPSEKWHEAEFSDIAVKR